MNADVSEILQSVPPETVVGSTVKIQGDLNSDGNIQIAGQVTGTVNTKQSVQVDEGAIISADITAGNAVIAGQVKGNITVSGQLVLQASANVAGDISCSVLRVVDGAVFSGKCAMGGQKPATKSATTSHEQEKEGDK